jgi:hypothetical protein
LIFWQRADAQATVIGSMALRAHMQESVRIALGSGLTDIDLLVSVEMAAFYSLVDQCVRML